MFKPKHIAPFFSMEPSRLTEILKDLRLVYPMEQTPLGSFLLKEEDLAIIEAFINANHFFQNKKAALVHFKEYIDMNVVESNESPEWGYFIRDFGT